MFCKFFQYKNISKEWKNETGKKEGGSIPVADEEAKL